MQNLKPCAHNSGAAGRMPRDPLAEQVFEHRSGSAQAHLACACAMLSYHGLAHLRPQTWPEVFLFHHTHTPIWISPEINGPYPGPKSAASRPLPTAQDGSAARTTTAGHSGESGPPDSDGSAFLVTRHLPPPPLCPGSFQPTRRGSNSSYPASIPAAPVAGSTSRELTPTGIPLHGAVSHSGAWIQPWSTRGYAQNSQRIPSKQRISLSFLNQASPSGPGRDQQS